MNRIKKEKRKITLEISHHSYLHINKFNHITFPIFLIRMLNCKQISRAYFNGLHTKLLNMFLEFVRHMYDFISKYKNVSKCMVFKWNRKPINILVKFSSNPKNNQTKKTNKTGMKMAYLGVPSSRGGMRVTLTVCEVRSKSTMSSWLRLMEATLQISTRRLPFRRPTSWAKLFFSTSVTMASPLMWKPNWPMPFLLKVFSSD